MTLGLALLRALKNHGAQEIFGIPGDFILPLFKQTVLNWVLIIVTLGLYWPFAQIALMRLKLQAITVHMRVNPDTLVSQARPVGSTGVGDAAVDLAGIDLGL